MTQKQAIKAMKQKYPGYSVRAAVTIWHHAHRIGTTTTYEVYAGNQNRAHAGGCGISFQDAFDICTEYPIEEKTP